MMIQCWYIFLKNKIGRHPPFLLVRYKCITNRILLYKMPHYKISIDTHFERTNTKSEEASPTPSEYDAFMTESLYNGKPRYVQYLADILGKNTIKSSKVAYIPGGTIVYTASSYHIRTAFGDRQNIIDYICENSFEDGIFEGVTAQFPTRATENYTWETHMDWPEELGVIECRHPDNFYIEKIMDDSEKEEKDSE